MSFRIPSLTILLAGIALVGINVALMVFLWCYPIPIILKDSSFLDKALDYVQNDSILVTLYLYYDTVMTFVRIITGVGLLLLKGWAHRLLMFSLVVTVFDFLGQAVILQSADPAQAGSMGISALMTFFWILWFRRDGIVGQFGDPVQEE